MNTDVRPWGFMHLLSFNKKSTIKLITVKPHRRNSLQYHLHRSEYWFFLDNPAKVTVGNKTYQVKKGDFVKVPIKVKHRVCGLSKPASFIEISYGKFDENDIIRLEDDYGRAKK
jgi:mannose-6-phosphate isomerase